MKIAVVGLGKIGLPLAVQYARTGHMVVGVDVDVAVVDAVNQAREPFPGERDLGTFLAAVVAEGRLRATTEYSEAVPDADAVVVCVPLFVDEDGRPDFSIMDSTAHSIGESLTTGMLVSFETTVPVGTTRGRLAPLLEEVSGLASGRDFFVVFSPERVLSGRVFEDLRRYPKIVGGLEPEGSRRALDFYQAVLDFDDRPDLDRPNGVWDVGSAETAEMTKLAETTYRDVNIALANRFALFSEANGIDVHRVIEAANSQPFSHIHRPGISVGGHCIPVYPHLYLENDPSADIVRVARATNVAMPALVVERLAREFGDLRGQTVAVLGAAYRGGVKETGFSGVFATVAALESSGATVRVHDVLYDDDEIHALDLEPYHLGEHADAVVVHTDHPEYRSLSRADLPGVRMILDGRGVVDDSSDLADMTLRIGRGRPSAQIR